MNVYLLNLGCYENESICIQYFKDDKTVISLVEGFNKTRVPFEEYEGIKFVLNLTQMIDDNIEYFKSSYLDGDVDKYIVWKK